MKLFPNFTRHHLITHTNFRLGTFDFSFIDELALAGFIVVDSQLINTSYILMYAEAKKLKEISLRLALQKTKLMS